MKNFYPFIIILTINLLIINFYLNGQLLLFIHPRYELFTLAMNILSLVIVSAFLMLRWYYGKPLPESRLVNPINIIVTIFLLAAIIQPPQSLSQAAVSQRQSPNTGLFGRCEDHSNPVGFLQWSDALRACQYDVTKFENDSITLSGFVYMDRQALDDDSFYVGRFVVNCCTIDATPALVPVYIQDWQQTYDDGQWVDITGVITVKKVQNSAIAVIEPTTINEIEEPAQPYEYAQF